MKKLLILALLFTFTLSSCSTAPEEVAVIPEVEAPVSEPVEEVEVQEEPATEVPVEVVEDTTPLEVKMAMPSGTPTLSAIKLYSEQPEFDGNVTVNYEVIEATDVLTSTLINGESDIAIVPTNLVATLNSKGLDYKLVGSSVWGTFYIASTEDITTIEDLKGKTITTFGQNLTPDAILKYVLQGNNIDYTEDLTLEYLGGASEVATNFIAGESPIALATEPVLTSMLLKNQDGKSVINIQEEWEKLTGFESYPQASLIISNELLESRPTFVADFISYYDESVDWVNENPKEAGDYYETLNIGLTSAILQKAIPNCSLDFVPTSTAKDSIATYLDILYNFNPKLLGDTQPSESIYYEK